MGSKPSKDKPDDTIIDDFLSTQIPLFLEKHCTVEEGLYMDPMHFWIAFKSFIRAEKIKFPSQLNYIDTDWLKYYFHQMDKSHCIYVTGAPSRNVLVGVTISKWPGKPDTDSRAQRNDEIRTIAIF